MKALEGLRLLDLTHIVSGPYAGLILADLGAETIKIEPPGTGEGTRKLLADHPDYSVNGMGAYFLALNRNKKSVTINLKSEAGLTLFYDLVKTADIVLDNFSAGVTHRLKIDHDRLAQINPKVITCSITGFGETGPDKDRPAFDLVVQAMGGEMSITGMPDSPPSRSGIPIGDLGGGMFGVMGILAAIVARQTTGCGQHIDISMLDVQISLQNYAATMTLLSGQSPRQSGNAHYVHVPYNTYPCLDGYIVVAVLTDAFWENLMRLVNLPELDTIENRVQPGRLKNKEQIDRQLGQVFSTNTQQHWLGQLQAARIPCSPVNTIAQALAEPQVLARNMVIEVEDATGHSIKLLGNPIKLSDTYEDTYSAPPLLGADTDDVLQVLLGKSPEQIALLRELGAI